MSHEIPSARESLTGKYDYRSVKAKIERLKNKDTYVLFDAALNRVGLDYEIVDNVLGTPEDWDEEVGKEISSLIGDIEMNSTAPVATQKETFAALAQYLNSL